MTMETLRQELNPTEKLQNALGNIEPNKQVGTYFYKTHSDIFDEGELLRFYIILIQDPEDNLSSKLYIPCKYDPHTEELKHVLPQKWWNSFLENDLTDLIEQIQKEIT